MSTLDKMMIKGIRSFGPEDGGVITFYRPLTLVVGANGAGKTTIIECLKNACTGELPPNARSGQSFIHDPKVDGATETKGQIKLRFKTATGKDVVCIRSFQLTQKASKMEYKAIESVLQTINSHTGEKVCLSYRCADMDREVPQLLGVSKAILENVIFVHQDEANWPLAEASVLKKKFDDIFSATRYTKALETLKKLQKEQTQEIKMQKLKLENVQTLKDAAYKLQENIENDQEKTKLLQSQVETLEPKIAALQRNIESMESMIKELNQVKNEITYKDGQRNSILRSKIEQHNALEEEIEDTDDEIAEWHVTFGNKVKESQREILELKRNMDSAVTQYNKLCELITHATAEVGKFEGEENAHQQDKRQCEAFIQQILTRYQLGNVVPPLDDQTMERCISKIKNQLRVVQKDHKQLKDCHEQELSSYSKKLEQLSKYHSDASGRIDGKSGQKRSIETRLGELTRAFRDMSSVETELSKCEEKLEVMDNEVKKLVRKMEEMRFEENINQEKINKQLLDQKIRTLRLEKASLDRESDDRYSLKLKKDDLAAQQRNMKRLIDDNKEKFRQVLKSQPKDPKTVKSEVDAAFSNYSKAYDDLLTKSRDVDMKVAQKATLARQITEKDGNMHFGLIHLSAAIVSRLFAAFNMEVDLDAFPGRLKEAAEKKESKKCQHDMADGMRRMFEPFERVARANHICPFCERKFTIEEEDEFVRKQRAKRAITAQRLQELASDFSSAENVFLHLDKLRPMYEENQKLASEVIPKSEKLVLELTQELQNSTEAQDDVSCVLAQSKAELGLVSELRITAQSIEEACIGIQNLENDVGTLEQQLTLLSSSSRSAGDVGEELERHEKQLEELNRKIDSLKEEYDYMKDDLGNCTRRKHAEEIKKADLEKKLERSKALRDEEKSLRQQKDQIDHEIELEKEQLAPLLKEKERHQKEFDAVKRKFKQELDASVQSFNDFDKEVHSVNQIWAKIKSYVERHQLENLETAKRKLSELHSKKEEEETKKNFFKGEVERVETVLKKQKEIARNIADNIKYRAYCADEERLMQEIRLLEDKVHALGTESDLDSELKKALREKQALVGEVGRHKGTIQVHGSNIARNRAELSQAQYKNIDKRYRAQLIQLKTTEMATKDLDKYYNAVDRALMRFHTMKMEEINKMIKELWQQTYRGQDIDYIEIRADAEGSATRSYSYRVVMRSGDAELEMRGRCSAGQKVLAALIIRLALAETFCLNCGILTLDEPTTNLDAANSESFAAALLRIMEERRSQENFQLIVITHDERFAQLIGQRQLAEKYYRVSKDENQHSMIEVQEIFS